MLSLNKITLLRTLLYSFAFLIPINQRISTINIGLILIVSLFNLKKEKLNFRLGLLFPVLLYLLYCISLLYSSEYQFNIIERKASLLVFPVIFSIFQLAKKDFMLLSKCFVYGCIVALIICQVNAIYNSIDFTNFIFDSRKDQTLSFYDSLTQDQNVFFSYNFSFLHQTVYFSMYLSFAITILLYYKVFNNRHVQNTVLFFIFLGLFQILNKASFIVVFIILIIKVYQLIRNKRLAVISSIILLVISTLLFISNPRFKSFNKGLIIDESEIRIKDFRKIDNTNPNYYNFRVMLWHSAVDLIKKNPIIGIGGGGSEKKLYETFAVKRQWYSKDESYNAHNQYLQIFLDLGIIGFTIFTLIFIFFFKHIRKFEDKKLRILATSFIVIVGINFLFESMLERYSGISFFCFFFCGLISFNCNIVKSSKG